MACCALCGVRLLFTELISLVVVLVPITVSLYTLVILRVKG